MTSNASLITFSQEILLKADIGKGEIPQPMGAECGFTTHTIIQNDSYFVEGLQGKAESDICTLDDDSECCSLDENAVVCGNRVAELQREVRHNKVMVRVYMVFSIISGSDIVICFLLFPRYVSKVT